MTSFAGKIGLVTGAARRIGRGIALGLARQGADLVLHYRSSVSEAQLAAEEIRAAGRRCWVLAADLAQEDQAAALVPRAAEAAGGLDILVNSASTFGPSTVLDFPARELEAQVRVNALAPLLLSRAFAKLQRPGTILNLLDARVTGYDPGHAAYHLSKRMSHALTRMLALELAPRIRVNAVAPGPVLPPAGRGEAYMRDKAREVPLRRTGDLEGLVEAVLFLLGSEFMTGQVLFYDGGLHMMGASHD